MTTKTETLYRQLLSLRVVDFDDIMEKAVDIVEGEPTRRYVHRKYISRLVDQGKLQRIRKGLYVALSPLERPEDHVADKLLVASKIRDHHYLGFHTALEYYGSAYSLYNEAYVCVKAADRFDPFTYGRFNFRPVFVGDTRLEVEEKKHHGNVLRVSSKERTFLDCVERVRYCGGWEECLKSLENLSGIDFWRLVDQLLKRDKQILIRRAGFVLELMRENSPFYEHLEEDVLEGLEERVSGPPRYLVEGETGNLNERWRLYVPSLFEERLRGV